MDRDTTSHSLRRRVDLARNYLRLALGSGWVRLANGALRMNAGQRIDRLVADRAAFPIRINEGDVAIPGKHQGLFVRG